MTKPVQARQIDVSFMAANSRSNPAKAVHPIVFRILPGTTEGVQQLMLEYGDNVLKNVVLNFARCAVREDCMPEIFVRGHHGYVTILNGNDDDIYHYKRFEFDERTKDCFLGLNAAIRTMAKESAEHSSAGQYDSFVYWFRTVQCRLDMIQKAIERAEVIYHETPMDGKQKLIPYRTDLWVACSRVVEELFDDLKVDGLAVDIRSAENMLFDDLKIDGLARAAMIFLEKRGKTSFFGHHNGRQDAQSLM